MNAPELPFYLRSYEPTTDHLLRHFSQTHTHRHDNVTLPHLVAPRGFHGVACSGNEAIAVCSYLSARSRPRKVIVEYLIQCPRQVYGQVRGRNLLERKVNRTVPVPQQTVVGQPKRLNRLQKPKVRHC